MRKVDYGLARIIASLIILAISPSCTEQQQIVSIAATIEISPTPTDTATSTPAPTATPTFTSTSTFTPTPSPANTSTNTPTPTPTNTATPTITPTPLGGTSPRIALYAKASDDSISIYVGDLYEGELDALIPITMLENNNQNYFVKWSPDGRQLLYVDATDQGIKTLYIFDFETRVSQKIMTLPDSYIHDIRWSPEMEEIAYKYSSGTFTRDMLVNLSDPTPENINSWTPSHWSNGPICWDQNKVDTVSAVYSVWEYPFFCFYPELGAFIGWEEAGNGLIMVTEDLQSETLVAKFPSNIEPPTWNGAPTIILSPDQSSVLLVGDYNWGNNLVFPMKLNKLPYEFNLEDLVPYACEYANFEARDYRCMNFYEIARNSTIPFSWSPDGKNYVASFGMYDINPERVAVFGEIYSDWHIGIINAQSNNVEFYYRVSPEITPMISVLQDILGIDIVWPRNQ